MDIQINQAMIASAKSQEQIDTLYNREQHNLILVKSISKRAGEAIPEEHSAKIHYVQAYIKDALSKLPKDKLEVVNIQSLYILPFGEAADSLPTVRMTCSTPQEAVEIRK